MTVQNRSCLPCGVGCCLPGLIALGLAVFLSGLWVLGLLGAACVCFGGVC